MRVEVGDVTFCFLLGGGALRRLLDAVPASDCLIVIAQIGQSDAAELVDVRVLGIGNERGLEIIQFDLEIARFFRSYQLSETYFCFYRSVKKGRR